MIKHLPETRFPATRMRRNRRTPWMRGLVRENTLTADNLIWPIFVVDGENQRQPVPSMPGVERFSVDLLTDVVGGAVDLGIPVVAIFPYTDPALKTPDGREAINPDNLVCRAVRAIRNAKLKVGILCDVALDPFNSDGHDGIVEDGVILNDETVEILCQQALAQAEAGCDIMAPSDMMDGRISAIRTALDGKSFEDVAIMSYAAKYASGFYGPFRDAVGSGGLLKGDKKTYQMDPANSEEALREVELDLAEGADSVMVKPGLPYLDIVRMAADRFDLPVYAYMVSGEYAMIEAMAAAGAGERDIILMEILTGFVRAGASGVLSYHAPVAARLLAK